MKLLILLIGLLVAQVGFSSEIKSCLHSVPEFYKENPGTVAWIMNSDDGKGLYTWIENEQGYFYLYISSSITPFVKRMTFKEFCWEDKLLRGVFTMSVSKEEMKKFLDSKNAEMDQKIEEIIKEEVAQKEPKTEAKKGPCRVYEKNWLVLNAKWCEEQGGITIATMCDGAKCVAKEPRHTIDWEDPEKYSVRVRCRGVEERVRRYVTYPTCGN